MALHVGLACVLFLALTSAERDQTRWSRQISSYTSDISDWVPLPGPVERKPLKRQAVAEPRILSEPVFPGFGRPTGFGQEGFPARNFYNAPSNRQLYLQSVPAVPSAPQNFLTDQGFGQNIRFGLSQPNYPLNQGFVGPQFMFDQIPQIKTRQPQVSNPIKFESFQKPNLPSLSSQAKPFNSQLPNKPESPKFVDGYRVENASADFSAGPKKRPQSLQKIKFENFDKVPKTEMIPPNKPKSEREEVQLLYVPLESLNRGQFNFRSPLTPTHLLNTEPHINQRPSAIKQAYPSDFNKPNSAPPRLPINSFGTDDDFFSNFNSYKDPDQIPKFSTIPDPFPSFQQTTPKPKKLKPHQPPLAIFLTQEAKKGQQVKVGDVLSSLKNAETIAVLDSVNPQTAPKVFIGPSSLNPSDNFVKFDLPYLSNIDHSDKKLRQLPFFVAPLSYNTPQGFAKIPFPSPHVGSVVINAQIRDSTTTITPSTPIDVIPNSYSTSPQSYKTETKPSTQKPSVSYYSTLPPKTNSPSNYQSSYYSFEPQTVSTLRPPQEPQASLTTPQKPGSYFLSNIGEQYNSNNYHVQNEIKNPEPVRAFNVAKLPETPTTPKAVVSTPAGKISTYPSQLLETHNPYSINQAFHFSTPPDYQNFFDETYATPGSNQPPTSLSLPQGPTSYATPKPTESVTGKQNYQSSPAYHQTYSPEIQYHSEVQNSRYNAYNDYTVKPEVTSNYSPSVSSTYSDNSRSVSSANPPTEYKTNTETQAPVQTDYTDAINNTTLYETDKVPSRVQYTYNSNEENDQIENQTTSTASTTTTSSTTTTRRPLRSKTRPRYTTTTTPRTDSSNESATRTVVTRRPLRERRPLPTRSRYEPNKITTERATKKPIDSSESTTKYSRGRTRGRVHYKPSESDEYFNKANKGHGSKEQDLAYQRDVLHQNYPVTLMERTSTVDIEAITEPSARISSTKNLETSSYYDTENAYSHDRASVSQQFPNVDTKQETYTSRTDAQTETPYVSKTSSFEEYSFQPRSSLAPVDAISSFGETSPEGEEDIQVKKTTPLQKLEATSFVTEPTTAQPEATNISANNEFSAAKLEEVTVTPDTEISKRINHESSREEEPEENIVQTTPSYNRVRVRPGVIRQYHPASTTESSRSKTDRKRLVQAVTYRPAFDRRRTTMRIEEIEADLKTKQIHARPETQDYRHPVYRPEPTTEPTGTSYSTQETTTKRGAFRRRRPTYTTTSTEASSTKKGYEVKSRFRGRRPTEKPTDKPEVQTDTSTSTVRSALYSRNSNRQRLSERYNKKQELENADDQDSNYSINRPKYVEPESEHWSPKLSTDSFKPYNPNDIADDQKIVTERKPENTSGDELDIITARNEYDNVLISVTPATNYNNRANKKIPDIPPTLEALVEQSKTTNSDSADSMSTFETMLEEVMKSLEEQDEDEYTSKVMKHKGGEIGEIPPERIITSGDNYVQKSTTVEQQETTTTEPDFEDSTHKEDEEHKAHRRGFWKKVKVRPITESIETAESQYHPHAVNRLVPGHSMTLTKTVHDKHGIYDKHKPAVTTYKPAFQFNSDTANNDTIDVIPVKQTAAQVKKHTEESELKEVNVTTEASLEKGTPTESSPGEIDLGTGSPDPTLIDNMYHNTPTEPAPTESNSSFFERSDSFSLMEYLFGVQPEDKQDKATEKQLTSTRKSSETEATTEQIKSKTTTETTFIPEEVTDIPSGDEYTETFTEFESKVKNSTHRFKSEEKATEFTETSVKVETSTESGFTKPSNVVSTSMSTEISHETEICFRGKCIKTSEDIL